MGAYWDFNHTLPHSPATSDGSTQKALKQSLAWFWIDNNQKFAANTIVFEKRYGLVEKCIDWSWTSSYFHFKDFGQSATEKNQLQCHWSTIHNLVLKMCLKFQVLSFHFSEVNYLL